MSLWCSPSHAALAPEKATKCNCSLCRRLADFGRTTSPEWFGYKEHPENTVEYVWGDKTLRMCVAGRADVPRIGSDLSPSQVESTVSI